ncbi:MAG: CDP-glucose 4,6-dehydratase [Thermodesulfobacteriota bacterium]
MENLEISRFQSLFNRIYQGRRVLVTGHTGFKGSWLTLWLSQMGAKVTGYSLKPATEPNHFNLLDLGINSIIGDIRDAENVKYTFKEQQPEIVFHLAAQAIVRASYKDPVETFTSNVMGTINVFEAVRNCDSVKAIVNVTSDKCYENKEWPWGYREIDPVGGYDPYSASKGCAEIITNCWRHSFFNSSKHLSANSTLIASARAGNVIGGGDWAPDRLIPDMVRAVSRNEKVQIRNPESIRPWQHVLEPLSGYLLLGQKLLEGQKECAKAWNFGPSDDKNLSVGEVVGLVKRAWPEVNYEIQQKTDYPHEAGMLKLDSSKARLKLKWNTVWDVETAIVLTIEWYKKFYESNNVLSIENLKFFILEARNKNMLWV